MKTESHKVAAVLGLYLVVAMAMGQAQARADEQELVEKIKQLERRVAELEGKTTQQVAVAKADVTQRTLDFLGQTEISGFVSASYIYDWRQTGTGGANGTIPGR